MLKHGDEVLVMDQGCFACVVRVSAEHGYQLVQDPFQVLLNKLNNQKWYQSSEIMVFPTPRYGISNPHDSEHMKLMERQND